MSPEETVALCRLVKAICPSQALDQYTPDAWALILRHIDYNDAKQAVIDIASRPLEPGKSRYIEPGHIIGGVRRIRAKRIEDYGPVSPPAGLDTAGYMDWLRETRHLIGSGLPPARQAVEVTAVPNGAELIAAIMQALPKEAS